MSIRPLSAVDVDSSQLTFQALGTSPKNDYESGIQQKHRLSGTPLWNIDVLVTQPDGTTATSTVTVPSAEAPSIPLLTPVSFMALRASTFGNAGLLLRADGVQPARATTSGRGE